MLGTKPSHCQPDDCLDRSARQLGCLLHHRNMDSVSHGGGVSLVCPLGHRNHLSRCWFIMERKFYLFIIKRELYWLFLDLFLFLTPLTFDLQVCYGCDEPPCLSCRELVGASSFWYNNTDLHITWMLSSGLPLNLFTCSGLCATLVFPHTEFCHQVRMC